MSGIVISGKELAKSKRDEMKKQTAILKEQGIVPGLAVILVGEDPASQSYVKAKQRACEETGIHSEMDHVSPSISEDELLDKIRKLNDAEHINGILVQLPLPDHISEEKVIETIDPEKDVDGFHPINIGRMMTGQEAFLPCTPNGIVEMIKSKGIDIQGKHVVVVGRSNIVGKPVGQLLLNEHATVTYCHSRTKNMQEFTRAADILVVAVGKEHFVKGEDIKDGAVVIDVGVNRNAEGKLTGDVEFDSASKKASYITPVPGGVGPMTITMLLQNTIFSAQRKSRK
ncbi:bifunctional methylenetetrahydrofolate dehydrogenase/methenyltetrahydrofolate cyclohydrolase FolD [Salisediminibacterium beveridgei]|uniref:Bifunctional protein FolD n=1 Tax=Salisediminibacterium beveridgei TaxID=632773 RepID=A0A1D7QUG7_9BACI|nr:bifunctional methylenetetrahydrofolate dehydrogenase/methenyltetrahydrofolate cyclohydrolase FolD [Salisediminibacterium beveridgei]AOM82670.1 Methylenetetrahydrofolate dehydrogenase (NADP+) / Methenyltetrahydrofolate cyclohydrolase [Salisediminibacterium beveridgei]